MAEMRTEEEQVEAIKNWWKKNGSSVLIGIAVALAIVLGWQAWQNHQASQRSEAAAAFNDLLTAAGQEASEENRETITYLARQLQEDHGGSAYAIYGTMLLAHQQLMNDDDPAAAIESLEWARSQADADSPLALVIRSRLARAQLAAGDYDGALATVRGARDADAFEALFAELEGDILLARGDRDAAGEAYLQAREAAGGSATGLLQLKLADLGVGGDA